MKKWIILAAMAILFLYPIISIMQMAFAGSFDLYLLVRSTYYSIVCVVMYLYFLWTVSSKHPVLSWSIFTILMILLISHDFAKETNQVGTIVQAVNENGLFRMIFEFLYMAVSFVVALGQGLAIQENRRIAARTAKIQENTYVSAIKKRGYGPGMMS